MRARALLFIAVLILFGFSPQPLAAAEVREIRVGVAVADAFKANPEWKEIFLKRLAYASQIFEREFKIKFRATEFWDWPEGDERKEVHTLIDDLMATRPLGEIDIVIGLTRYVPVDTLTATQTPPPLKDIHVLGSGRAFSGYLVIRYPTTALYRVQEETVLIHELGHLFGAVHTEEPETIMAAVVTRQIPTAFDEENRLMIARTRDMDFRKGLDQLNRDTIRQFLSSYQKLIGSEQTFDFYRDMGTFYLRLGQPEDAVGAWSMALRLLPRHARTVYDLGMLYYKMERYDEARDRLAEAVLLLSPATEAFDKASALHALGNISYARGDEHSAYQYWTESGALAPDYLENKIHLVVSKIDKGLYRDAERELLAMLQTGGGPQVLGSLGLLSYREKQYEKAVSYFEQALTAAPAQTRHGVLSALDIGEPSELHQYAGLSYLALGQRAAAVSHLEAALSENPSIEGHKALGEAYCRFGDWENCAAKMAALLHHIKDDPEIYYQLGVAFQQKGAVAKALEVFNQGLPLVRDSKARARFHKHIGDLYRTSKNWDEAAREFQRAMDADWSDPDSHFGLALVYISQRKVDDARRALKNVLLIDPNHQQAKEILDKL